MFVAQGRFAYENGILHCENVSIQELVKTHETPFYVYSSGSLTDKIEQILLAAQKARLKIDIRYAAKANSNISVLETVAQAGLGVEVVSGGEIRTAIAAGFEPSRMIFSGAAKSRSEISSAVAAGVDLISVESVAETRRVSEAACARGAIQKVLARVQGAPIEKTTNRVSSAARETKFGIPNSSFIEDFETISRLRGVALEGLSFHIGTQLNGIEVFDDYFRQFRGIADKLIEGGHIIRTISIGGGLPAEYRYTEAPMHFDIEKYISLVKDIFSPLQCNIIACPGRYISAEAGALVTSVIDVKGSTKQLVVVDAGFNDLLRPALFGGHHEIIPMFLPKEGAELSQCDVVGALSEAGDSFGSNRLLPPTQEGDVLILSTAGAYSASHASNYSGRGLASEIFVTNHKSVIARPRLASDTIFLLRDRIGLLAESNDGSSPILDQQTIAEVRAVIAIIKTELQKVTLGNDIRSEIEADITQISAEIDRPAPRKKFFRVFLESLSDNLAKTAGVAAAGGALTALTAAVVRLAGLL